MNDKELTFYNEIKNWDFSQIKYYAESLTNWDLYTILNNVAKQEFCILDLGTGGGERVLEHFPKVKEILGTDFSDEMIKTANNNLQMSGYQNISFKVMDNLNMTTQNDYFDIVVARHTPIDAKQIYKTLKPNGILLLQGVDKLDCWALKMLFKKGQAYNEIKPISLVDYENVLKAGFRKVELVPIHIREYFEAKEDLLALLLKTPIIRDDINDEIDINKLDRYIKENTTDKGILLIRRYYGITAVK